LELDDMRFIVSDTESNDFLVEYFGPWVARKFGKYYNHTKMILVDDEILLLWSMNLSDTSLDKNREIWILIIDKDVISEYKKLFENDRKISK
jgi:phosphatidylserine/phosphatidylglycerophosphate/cardiolipin synthase-like enzyme